MDVNKTIKVISIGGLKYSRDEFPNYKIRCKVKIKTVDEEFLIDVYTTDTDKNSVEGVLLDRKSDKVFSLTIIDWKTKEQDDAMGRFLDEMLTKGTL